MSYRRNRILRRQRLPQNRQIDIAVRRRENSSKRCLEGRRKVLLRSLLVGITFFVTVHDVKSDTPLPPPTPHTVMSSNGEIRVSSDPHARTTIQHMKRHPLLWSLPPCYTSI